MIAPVGPFQDAGVEVPAPKRIPVPRSEHEALNRLCEQAEEILTLARRILAALEKRS